MNKKCSKCGEIKDSSAFYTGRGDCKQCKITRSRARYAPIKDGVRQKRQSVYRGELKLCKKCKGWFPLDNYCRKLDNWDNLNHTCKECMKQKSKKYRKANTERERISGQEWYRNNRDRKRKSDKEWRTKNPEKSRAIWHRYKARKLFAEGDFTPVQLSKLLNHYCPDGICLGCGKKKRLTIDHVVPLFRGGTNYITNLQPICKSCNSKKGDEIIVDYRPDLGLFTQSLMEGDK